MGSNLEKLMDDKIEEVQSQIVSAQESKIASLAVKIRKVAVRGGGSAPGAACVGVLGAGAWGWAGDTAVHGQADSANALQLMKNFGRDKNSEGGKLRETSALAESTAARAEGLYVMIGAVMGELAEVKKDGTAIRAMAVRVLWLCVCGAHVPLTRRPPGEHRKRRGQHEASAICDGRQRRLHVAGG